MKRSADITYSIFMSNSNIIFIMASLIRPFNSISTAIYTFPYSWETYKTMSEAKKRKKEIEYRADIGQMIVPHCKTVKELLEEYVNLYGKEA